MATTTTFEAGSLVRARGREWVVQADSQPDLLMLRPLGGTDEEVTGIYLPLEKVEPAEFAPPDPSQAGDHLSCQLLRDAVRLSLRSSTGPFRSFAGLAVDPRPYQLVPLLMALKLDTIRLLIADDVGIGKTVEALLVVKELLDRHEANGVCVLCPPHLAEQWQGEMRSKFNLDAEVILPSTASRLERQLRIGQSIFQRFPITVVSIDYIKSDRRREDFLRTCPDLVVIDEAHTCAAGPGARHLRHSLLRKLASQPERHIVMVTATPHSGNEEAFRSLLALLRDEFKELPEDLSGEHNEKRRRALAQHLVQRRRGDIRAYLNTDTPFPERLDAEETYTLSPGQRQLFEEVLAYARELVRDPDTNQQRQRVRWWSALGLLRTLSSSPAAAMATLQNRAATLQAESAEEVNELGSRLVLDPADEGESEGLDLTPGGDLGHDPHRKRLTDLARQAEKLKGKQDAKLQHFLKTLEQLLLKDKVNPIVFCRFIDTAHYLAEALRLHLGKKAEVVAITGELPPAEREERVQALGGFEKRVLVATDCLSEGINLQEWFNAVIHYDLSWNPTRHEQREGRVDRYGQQSAQVKVLTYYGRDNPVDGIVLEVLLRKHKSIKKSLGISVPIPVDTNQIVEALMEGLLLRAKPVSQHQQLQFDFGFADADKKQLFREWDSATERERRSRTLFAQHSLDTREVERELQESLRASGGSVDVQVFLGNALRAHRGYLQDLSGGHYRVDLQGCPSGLREAVAPERQGQRLLSFGVRFEPRARQEKKDAEGELYLHRTHPVTEELASYVLDTSLDPILQGVARRCGVTRTRGVQKRTTLLLLRLRFHLTSWVRGGEPRRTLAEEVQLTAFRGSPTEPEWLTEENTQALLALTPDANVSTHEASHFLGRILPNLAQLEGSLRDFAHKRARQLHEAHDRVRATTRRGARTQVDPQLPLDILGLYVFLPSE